MKNHLLTLLIITTSFTCLGQTADQIQKAKGACLTYLKRHLNDPASYKAASWSKLSRTYSSFDESSTSRILNDSLEYYRKAHDAIGDKLHSIRMSNITKYGKDSTYIHYTDLNRQVDSATTHLQAVLSSKEKSFKPVFDGYIVLHSFRARNKFNAMVLQNYQFLLSKSFKVISASDADENEREREDLQRRIDELTKGAQ